MSASEPKTIRALFASSRWTAFMAVLLALVVLTLAKADLEVVRTLATAVLAGLPFLIGGEAWRRIVVDRPQRSTVATATPLGASVTTTGGPP